MTTSENPVGRKDSAPAELRAGQLLREGGEEVVTEAGATVG